jgi:glycogen phosphorylase/synthase
MDTGENRPEFIFETSWEVCNKVGGIHTVISTKAKTLIQKYPEQIIFIGPDIWKDHKQNIEFIEDKTLYRSWKIKAQEEGLRIRIGRWDIPGNPMAILVDFTAFIQDKDKIFASFWESFKLDSISGQWDYVEPALFGYAAGKIVESFSNFNFSPRDKVIAHFHEWMTGTGVLYIEQNAPYISTLFTTHATTLGRSIAGNNIPLYENIDKVNPESKAQELGVVSKQSLEKIAANKAGALTTVSEITNRECEYFLGRKVDSVTPNGFEDNFVPNADEFDGKRNIAREKLRNVAEKLLGYKLKDDFIIAGTSGRYEFRNKGIDVYLDALSQLNKEGKLNKEIVNFILIPANQHGARKDLIEALNNNQESGLTFPFSTHYLTDVDYDPTINNLKKNEITNSKESKIKVIFVPTYLNGQDGIFNLSYYDLLIGFDLTIFASYYEPWGYTPLESIAFKVPTITTSLAGFGQWAKDNGANLSKGVDVIERTDSNYHDVVQDIAKSIEHISGKSEKEMQDIRQNAFDLSKKALWGNFIEKYEFAYNKAIKNTINKELDYNMFRQKESTVYIESRKSNEPHWRKLFVQTKLPEQLIGLDDLSRNVWWSWNYKAKDLFKGIDPKIWSKSDKNPITFLKNIPQSRWAELVNDKAFMKTYQEVYEEFKAYMAEEIPEANPKIAYFSMEYGLNDNLKIFSGGLGILAGDYLKEASDTKTNITAVGLLYKFGYFTQRMSLNGEQLAQLDAQKFSNLPLVPIRDNAGNLVKISINMPGREISARIWRVDVGRIPLYLLDTDISDNSDADRSITNQLYGGDWENRLKQEILLGLGGIRALNALEITPNLYHCNEGHAALINVERLANLTTKENFSFEEALEIVRSSSLFTTHTPVPAGHDTFTEDLIRTYLRHMPERLNISWEKFLGLGKVDQNNPHEKFSMSNLAANTSQEMNGVSMLHGEVSRDMFVNLWPGYSPEELHIGHVTNGVHYPTWTAKEWRQLYEANFGDDFLSDQSNLEHWNKIYEVPDEKVWGIKNQLRKKLVDYAKIRFQKNWVRRYEDPKKLVTILNKIDENTLTIGFARRFATYKRAHLLFNDLERLARIVNNEKMPVQFIFAGKAHPNDKAGQDLIKHIIDISRRPEFVGKILFLENYDIELGKRLVKGVDVWLNTPTRPLEASGTSGQKAEMNGTLNFSVLDGWWLEGYKDGAGWALTEKRTYDNQDFQDQLDAQTIYSIFENDLIPLFYDRNKNGIPENWVQYVKKSIAEIAPVFTTKRMIDDYCSKFYIPMYNRSKAIFSNDYEKAIKIASWKKRIGRSWDDIDVVSIDFPSTSKKTYNYGETYNGEVVLDLKELVNEDIRVELVVSDSTEPSEKSKIIHKQELVLDKKVESVAFYKLELPLSNPGVFDYGLRIFPFNEYLAHRQDFNYIRWI